MLKDSLPRPLKLWTLSNVVGDGVNVTQIGSFFGEKLLAHCLLWRVDMSLVERKIRDNRPVQVMQRGIAQGDQARSSSGLDGFISSYLRPAARIAVLGILSSGLGACAVGSMGAMVGGGADGVANLTETSSTQQAQAILEHPRQAEFNAFADVIDTPVWAALGPLDEEDGGRFNFRNMVGTLMAGVPGRGTSSEPETPASDAERYLRSMDAAFDSRSEVAMAIAVDVFRKNSETRRFIGAARDVVNGHARPVTAVNVALQSGDLTPSSYRSELASLDADQRVLSRVVTSLMDQRRTFMRVRTILETEDPDINLGRLDEELASLSQYEEMVMRLSGVISGEQYTGS